MIDQCFEIGENAQWTAVTGAAAPLDRVPEPFVGRPFAIYDLHDFVVAEMVPDGFNPVYPNQCPRLGRR